MRILQVALLVLFSLAACPAVNAQVITSIKRASVSPTANAQGTSYSYDPNISGDGQFVASTSTADNFAAAGVSEGQLHEHLYLRDVTNGVTTQLDITSSGRTGTPGQSFNPNLRVFRSSIHPHISRDGKYIVFLSPASNISPNGAGESFGS